ncbi:MAG: hypothetical protein J6K46_01485 [Sutterella sp.]|nr:hypothetical protein [Sutterella sp.]
MSNEIVGSTNYYDLNKQMISADLKVGDTAAEVDKTYQEGRSSFAKKVVLSIFTVLTGGILGIGWAIAHAVRSHGHSKALRQLTEGTQNMHAALKDLMKADPEKEFNRTVMMCGEKVQLVRNPGEATARVVFEDGSEENVNNPDEICYQIERDVMKHSQYFNRGFVVGILNDYKDQIEAGPKTRNNLREDLNEAHQRANQYAEEGTLGTHIMNGEFSAQRIGSSNRQAPLTISKNRAAELLSDLFSTRLELSPAEVKYIDLRLGIQLADNVLAGSLETPEAVRAFINRNAAGNHFTTVESAKIFAQFEKAFADENSSSVKKSADFVSTSSVSFKDNYYQPKPNPALPVGKEKEVHDFVSEMVSSRYAHAQDTSHNTTALKEKDGTLKANGERLRTLFRDNYKLVGELMTNRAEVKAGKTQDSLLKTLDPRMQAALETEIDRLEEHYQKYVEKQNTELNSNRHDLERAINENWGEGDVKFHSRKIENLEKRLANPLENRRSFLLQALSDVANNEKKEAAMFGTSDISELTDEDLNQMGDTAAGRNNEYLQAALKNKRDEGDKNAWYMDSIRAEIQIGADFFAHVETKIDENVVKSTQELQAQVNALIADVFPAQQPMPAMSPEDIQKAGFGEIIGNAAQDGQMQLVKKALEHYFSDMPDIDKRSMVAAGIRFSKTGISKGAQLGAILKGAGPVMQKMLQGLDPSMFTDPDFRLALGDMKDKLAPIAPRAVQAYLYDIIRQSNGAIKSIEVEKALGAASVAQALKCKIHNQDGTTVDCVVKILRPEAAQRARREEAVFQAAAKEVGNGMEKTFSGQFAAIMEELDLRTEAENVRIGNRVYDYQKSTYNDDSKLHKGTLNYGSFSNVHAMKLVDGIEPSANVMVLEQVPGTTLENYLKETGAESRRIGETARSDIQDRGQANAPQIAFDGAQQLTKLYNDAKAKYDALVNLSYMWTNEGLFAEGFYHGDVHKGNVMVDVGWKPDADPANPYKGITLIDFGNASHLNADEKKNVVRVVAGTAVGDAELFAKGFRELLTPESRTIFDNAGQELKDKLAAIFAKGTVKDTASRLAAALKLMQRENKIEVPGPIHNFLESQRRLQVALDEADSTVKAIAAEREALVKPYVGQMTEEQKTEIENVRTAFANDQKNKKTMVKCLTDVVTQNLTAALTSVGLKKGAACFTKIQAELNVPETTNEQPASSEAEPVEEPVEIPPYMNPDLVAP